MKKLGFGIIGTGAIATMHALAIKDMEAGKLVGCFDIRKEASEKFASKYDCKAYSDLDLMLSNPDIAIITVATPSGLHLEGALKAARAKKHVIVEKPLEVTGERCDQIINAAKENNVLLAGIFPTRFHESSVIVKKAIDEGRLGKIVLCDAYIKWFRSQAYYDSGAWRGTWKLDGGGALMNQSIHAVDMLQWLSGGVESVNSFTDTVAHERIEVEDVAVSRVKFKNGAVGVIEGTTCAYPGMMKKIELCGTKGTIVLEENNILVWVFEEKRPEDEEILKKYGKATTSGGGAGDPMAIDYKGHQRQFENMVNAIENGEKLLVDGEEAKKAVSIIEAIYQSSKNNETVSIK